MLYERIHILKNYHRRPGVDRVYGLSALRGYIDKTLLCYSPYRPSVQSGLITRMIDHISKIVSQQFRKQLDQYSLAQVGNRAAFREEQSAYDRDGTGGHAPDICGYVLIMESGQQVDTVEAVYRRHGDCFVILFAVSDDD